MTYWDMLELIRPLPPVQQKRLIMTMHGEGHLPPLITGYMIRRLGLGAV